MLTKDEVDILEKAKEANPWWFKAVIYAGSIMTERRQKYAGVNHPYHNFIDMMYRTGINVSNIFKYYLNIKASRISTTEQDFSDERIVDTWVDAANYSLIGAGYFLGGLTPDDVLTRTDWEKANRIERLSDNDLFLY